MERSRVRAEQAAELPPNTWTGGREGWPRAKKCHKCQSNGINCQPHLQGMRPCERGLKDSSCVVYHDTDLSVASLEFKEGSYAPPSDCELCGPPGCCFVEIILSLEQRFGPILVIT